MPRRKTSRKSRTRIGGQDEWPYQVRPGVARRQKEGESRRTADQFSLPTECSSGTGRTRSGAPDEKACGTGESAAFARTSEEEAAELLRPYGYVTDPDTSRADYVWLPFRFDGDMAYLDWHDEWCVDDHA